MTYKCKRKYTYTKQQITRFCITYLPIVSSLIPVFLPPEVTKNANERHKYTHTHIPACAYVRTRVNIDTKTVYPLSR